MTSFLGGLFLVVAILAMISVIIFGAFFVIKTIIYKVAQLEAKTKQIKERGY